MRSVLLDTNAFAMVLTDDPRLPPDTKRAILSASRVSISAITFYEIGQKVRLGKWDAMARFAPDLVGIALEAGFDLISLSAGIAGSASLLEWSHRDPFDRMIAAVAIEEGSDLISSDQAFDDLKTSTAFGPRRFIMLSDQQKITPRLSTTTTFVFDHKELGVLRTLVQNVAVSKPMKIQNNYAPYPLYC